MKRRGIIEKLEQIKCGLTKHEYEYIECGSVYVGHYFLYRCRGCGKNKVIFCRKLRDELDEIDPVKAISYPVEELIMPADYGGSAYDNVFKSHEAGYLISRYWEKEGILISAYGNRKERERESKRESETEPEKSQEDEDRIDTDTLEETTYKMQMLETINKLASADTVDSKELNEYIDKLYKETCDEFLGEFVMSPGELKSCRSEWL